ncbi:MAG: PEP-CTERM sorting domain-containing protein [Cyanobacteria bacterium J06632_22]
MANELVINGGFDDFDLTEGQRGNRTNWNYFDGEYLDANQAELGWQVTTGGTLEVRRDGVAGRAHNEGGHFAELDAHNYRGEVGANDTLGIFQDLVTEIGQTYQVSFAYAARPNIDGDRNQFEVSFGDTFSHALDGGNGRTAEGRAWKTFVQDIVATSELTRLQFDYQGRRDTLGAHLDSVSVTAVPGAAAEQVPEPATLAGLALMGLMGMGSVKKRRQAAA